MLIIIYFTSGSTVEEKDKVAIEAIKDMLNDNLIKGRVYIRNSRYVNSVEEYADGVAGLVPECYRLHNNYADAITKWADCKAESIVNLDETPAPNSVAEKIVTKRRGRQPK